VKQLLRFFANNKILTATIAVVLALQIALLIILTQFTVVSWDNVLTIIFDKRQMNQVNRIEVETVYGVTVINDQGLIADFVAATMTANNSPQCWTGFYWPTAAFRLYQNDRLVRDMELEFKHYQVRVYFPSARHWLILGYSHSFFREHGGVIILSHDLRERVNAYLKADDNRLCEYYLACCADPWNILDD